MEQSGEVFEDRKLVRDGQVLRVGASATVEASECIRFFVGGQQRVRLCFPTGQGTQKHQVTKQTGEELCQKKERKTVQNDRCKRMVKKR